MWGLSSMPGFRFHGSKSRPYTTRQTGRKYQYEDPNKTVCIHQKFKFLLFKKFVKLSGVVHIRREMSRKNYSRHI